MTSVDESTLPLSQSGPLGDSSRIFRRPSNKAKLIDPSPIPIGTLINIYWPGDKMYYPGYVNKFDPNRGLYIYYIDGDRQWIDIAVTNYVILQEALEQPPPKKRTRTKDTLKRVEEELLCPICQDLFVDPYSFRCTHTYCYSCLEHFFKQNSAFQKTCPMCKEPVNAMRDAHSNVVIKSVVNVLNCDMHSTPASSVVPRMQVPPTEIGGLLTLSGAADFVSTKSKWFKCHNCGGEKPARNTRCTGRCLFSPLNVTQS